ncbi:L-seryl-tRNA(Sec) selenium transferase [Tissierella creatinophila DSM 6911]|uniref:L-seryl-tRNA(Sec) selenium transferase n=2 Tax=Tissierella creatinophila TaxID=79681 RepID=A0A1U7M7T5_TISCR|nr:L-seryl-tRNA(Sec) selenium transferase [Tissierella creatinophila DSM 6911]
MEIIKELLEKTPRNTVLETIREELDDIRESIKKGELDEQSFEKVINLLSEKIYKNSMEKNSYNLKRVINATGVVLHTNLGRSLLNEEVLENIKNTSINYSNLEFDIDSGTRGSRYAHIEDIIKKITGAEGSLIVNNNAAAVMLVLSTMAKDKEVIVSRGELIEIGGSFRIPDVMERSGAKLVDVGATNKTHLDDYEAAIGENTAALLKVHTSNYRIMGFTSSVDSKELNGLKEKYNLPLIEDLGSGVLIDLEKYGMEHEPTVQDSLGKGVDIVTFSGDKLLGGPQVGIIVGKKEYIEKMKKNPLTRAFRVDKLVIAALETILSYYIDEEDAIKKIPTLRMLTISLAELNKKAVDLEREIKLLEVSSSLNIVIEDSMSEVGGGSLPLVELPTKAISINSTKFSTQKMEVFLRKSNIPIITRVYKDKLYFDLRTIREDEYKVIVETINNMCKTLKERI